MNVAVHLIATPWASWGSPSIQIGALKAHLDRAFAGAVPTTTYSAHFSIIAEAAAASGRDLVDLSSLGRHGEYLYFLLYRRRFLHGVRNSVALTELLDRYAVRSRIGDHAIDGDGLDLSIETLDLIETATCAYLDDVVAPALDTEACNVVGFTMNYDQVYASLYCLRHLEAARPDATKLFVFGGMSAMVPSVHEIFAKLGVDAQCVIGEGERKLEGIVRAAAGLPAEADADAQLATLDDLPAPDYDEYFATVRDACADDDVWIVLSDSLTLLVEGSRGCFARCDFCGLNAQWNGFRKRTATRIAETVDALTARHGIKRVDFVDNVCDTWAEAFADDRIRRGSQMPMFMELRAHHPEAFWVRLGLAGVIAIQIGVEAIAPALLAQMGKGTRVIQNLRAHKYLRELGIKSNSNLITHHPRSTLADIDATVRIARLVPHLGVFTLSRFRLALGSPLFAALALEDQRAARSLVPVELDPTVDDLLLGWGSDLVSVGDTVLDPAIARAWDRFRGWYTELVAAEQESPSLCTVRPIRDGAVITRTFYGTTTELILDAPTAAVYDACHAGPTLAELGVQLGRQPAELEQTLDMLIAASVLLEVDGYYLALAVRDREQLVSAARERPRLRARRVAGLEVIA